MFFSGNWFHFHFRLLVSSPISMRSVPDTLPSDTNKNMELLPVFPVFSCFSWEKNNFEISGETIV